MSAQLRIGLGETVITPHRNVQMYGFSRSQVSTGVHDDLYAKSLVLEGSDGTVAVFLVLSLCGLARRYVEDIRSRISKRTGIDGGSILISCTHTHAGPKVGEENLQDVGGADPEYPAFLTQRAVESVVQAWEGRSAGRVGVGSTVVVELGRARRRLLYGGLHPDPEVGVIKIENDLGELRGVAYVYGCHPSTLDWQNTLFSEDWVYYANEGIREEVGENIWTAFFQSAEGDINCGYMSELSAVGVDMPIRDYGYIEIKGRQMAEAVLDVLPDIPTADEVPVRVSSGMFDYPLRESYPVTLEEAEREAEAAEKRLAELSTNPELENTRLLDHYRIDAWESGHRLRTAQRFYKRGEGGGTTPIEHHAVRIGSCVLVSLPGEVFSEIGRRIKAGSSFSKTFCIGIANGYNGYLPTREEYRDGGYEVDGCMYSPGAEEACVRSALDIIDRVRD